MSTYSLPIQHHKQAERCPWCDRYCLYVEEDEYGGSGGKIRVGAACVESDNAFLSDRNDAMGNDYGRGEWSKTIEAAIDDWNDRVRRGRKTDQRGVW